MQKLINLSTSKNQVGEAGHTNIVCAFPVKSHRADEKIGTEWGYFMPAAPEDTPSLLSRQIDLEYTSKICKMAFPDGKWNTIPTWPNVTRVNQYGDFDLEATRIAFIEYASHSRS